jgi:hypothetical protein
LFFKNFCILESIIGYCNGLLDKKDLPLGSRKSVRKTSNYGVGRFVERVIGTSLQDF